MILVANGDDAGVDLPRNRGILRAARQGILRSASLLVGLAASRDFVERSRSVEGLGVGLHINLTHGVPLATGHRTLVGKDGRFLAKRDLWRRSVKGELDPAEARREIEAQWNECQALGVQPSHVDGHNHVHLFPGVAEAFLEVIPAATWVRIPRARSRKTRRDRPPDPFADGEVLSATLGMLAEAAIASGWTRFRSADRCEGHSLRAGYDAAALIQLIDSVEKDGAGLVELMTHPGETCLDSVPYSAKRDRSLELEALTAAEVLTFVRERKIRLASFGELS